MKTTFLPIWQSIIPPSVDGVATETIVNYLISLVISRFLIRHTFFKSLLFVKLFSSKGRKL